MTRWVGMIALGTVVLLAGCATSPHGFLDRNRVPPRGTFDLTTCQATANISPERTTAFYARFRTEQAFHTRELAVYLRDVATIMDCMDARGYPYVTGTTPGVGR